jgi:putative hydrolase of the HAD superfamily
LTTTRHTATLEGLDHHGASAGLSAIVFDLDGTLYESPGLAEEIHRSAVRYVAGLWRVGLEDAATLLNVTRSRLAKEKGREVPLTHACSELGGNPRELHRHFIFDVDPTPHLQPDQRVLDLLADLGSRYPLHIYTNNNQVLTERIMGLLGLSDLFDGIFTIEFTWRPKPDITTLFRLLATIGTTSCRTLFVGDRYDIDLLLPASLGAPVAHVTTIPQLLGLRTLITEKKERP